MKIKNSYFLNSFIWGVIAKVINALAKFISIPLLIHSYGSENYGVLTLALSTNAYMLLLDMGMNTGAIKFFSQWIGAKKFEHLDRVARTSISFYMAVGLLNAIILLFLSLWGRHIFNITDIQFELLRTLLMIIAAFTITNWVTSVFNQLLIADEKIALVQKIEIAKNLLNLLLVYITVKVGLNINLYFLFFMICNFSIIIPLYYLSKKRGLISSIIPLQNWKEFKPLFNYSLAIFAISLFQVSATQTRPLILGIFTQKGVSVLTEYRIIEVFPIFIITLGGLLISIFLPKTSKYIYNNDNEGLQKMAYIGTRYTSIFATFLCFPIILNAKEILFLYVGNEYVNLDVWLVNWVFIVLMFLHNAPIASMVLAKGKTKMLVYSTAIASTISIVINASLCAYFEVGSAIIGYGVYIIIQMSFYYFYFNRRVLNLNSWTVFKSFIIPTSIAILVYIPFLFIDFHFSNIGNIIIKTLLWGISYFCILIITKTFDTNVFVTLFKQDKK